MQKPLVFISHITTEKEIAVALKRLVEQAFLGMVEVFVSSDPNSIAMGVRWLDNITFGLKKCVIEIVLASPASVSRPWINFEAGAGWVRDIPVIPLCHSGMTPSALPAPLSSLQAALATESANLERVFAVIAKAIDCKMPEVDYQAFIATVAAFEKVSVQIQEMFEKSPLADEGGLNQHEFAALVTIADDSELPGTPVWPSAVIRAMTNVGYRSIAATLGMAGLERKGLIEFVEVDNHSNEAATVIRITPPGWAWLEENIERIELRSPANPAPSQGDDIPF
jgi:hypothetical protein